MASHSQRPRGERLVIGITGRIGSGKTSIGQHLSSRYGFQYVRYSQILSEWLAKDPESKAHLQEVGWKVMAGGMQTELNHRLIAQILPDADVAVDGLRHPIDYELLKQTFLNSFHLLYIDSPAIDRWERLKSQPRYGSFEAFEAADSHPVEQQIESLRGNAELIVDNRISLQEFYAAVDGAVRAFRKEGH
jgi:dephospho-CoA kinase